MGRYCITTSLHFMQEICQGIDFVCLGRLAEVRSPQRQRAKEGLRDNRQKIKFASEFNESGNVNMLGHERR